MKSVAVIGGGIAGISAAYYLQNDYNVTLFEGSDKLGGHAHSVKLGTGTSTPFDLDIAFLIFNELRYPLFQKFLENLGVAGESAPVDMSINFSLKNTCSSLYLGKAFRTFVHLVAQPSRLYKLRILNQLRSFLSRARLDLYNGSISDDMTVTQYLATGSSPLVTELVESALAIIWSTPSDLAGRMPVKSVLNFFDNHLLLGGSGNKSWRCFPKSSRVYVDAFTRSFRGTIYLNTPVKEVAGCGKKQVVMDGTSESEFDYLILATHAPTSLSLLSDPSSLEKRLLGSWQYSSNQIYLHTDTSRIVGHKNNWACWNTRHYEGRLELTYYLNRILNQPLDRDYLVTVSPLLGLIKKPIYQTSFDHPLFTSKSLRTQRELGKLNDQGNRFFCGSYFGYGFHEDAVFSSASLVQKILGRRS